MSALTASLRLSYSPRNRTYAIAGSARSFMTWAIVPRALIAACSASRAASLAASPSRPGPGSSSHQRKAALDLGGGPLVGRLRGEVGGRGEALTSAVDLVGREGLGVDPQVLDRRRPRPSAELLRWPTLKGTFVRIVPFRVSACDLDRPGLAVDVDLDPGGLARAVVGDEDMVPVVRLERRRRRRP